ncbi:3'-5' exonuclease [Alloalcanivorax mobilis]|mgnify:CR=1 FL=1|uniref:3'-5' exonuclease n=1 Tax=Alloalcanivorax mobilis TaxID=2019569 RepID=UPI001E335766|nr:3'-5' exonuclease [Alloalcanivorax mobilis]|tara:strand:- start:30064 stop:30657 length:594 start_codon:yes stop_codon:yes gene_type:complete
MLKRMIQRHRHGAGPFGHLFQAPDGQELMALDCETTGLDPRRCELVSVAAVPIRAGRVQAGAALDLRIRTPASLDAQSIRVHRLRGVDLEDGLEAEQALERLLDFIGNRPLVGWCLDFDLTVLNRVARRHTGFDLPNPVIELSDLYRRHQARRRPDALPDLRFESAARCLGVPVIGRHSARGDATTAALMYLRLKKP